MNSNIIMKDWAGNILFQGDYKSAKVDEVLEANRCECEGRPTISDDCQCPVCDSTGYEGDFTVEWEEPENAPYENVYACINY